MRTIGIWTGSDPAIRYFSHRLCLVGRPGPSTKGNGEWASGLRRVHDNRCTVGIHLLTARFTIYRGVAIRCQWPSVQSSSTGTSGRRDSQLAPMSRCHGGNLHRGKCNPLLQRPCCTRRLSRSDHSLTSWSGHTSAIHTCPSAVYDPLWLRKPEFCCNEVLHFPSPVSLARLCRRYLTCSVLQTTQPCRRMD